MIEIWDRVRGTEGVEGSGTGYPLPSRLGGLSSWLEGLGVL